MEPEEKRSYRYHAALDSLPSSASTPADFEYAAHAFKQAFHQYDPLYSVYPATVAYAAASTLTPNDWMHVTQLHRVWMQVVDMANTRGIRTSTMTRTSRHAESIRERVVVAVADNTWNKTINSFSLDSIEHALRSTHLVGDAIAMHHEATPFVSNAQRLNEMEHHRRHAYHEWYDCLRASIAQNWYASTPDLQERLNHAVFGLGVALNPHSMDSIHMRALTEHAGLPLNRLSVESAMINNTSSFSIS